MVEVRSYAGSAEDLSQFVVGVWRESYGGRMAFPLWSPEYLRWQLGVDSPSSDPTQLIAAYDGTTLVGTILGFPCRFRTPSGEVNGSQGSWLSVSKPYRRQGVATMLRQELRRRHADNNLAFQIGYGYFGSPHSLGPSFWESQRELGTTSLARVGFWARVLDAGRAAAWNVSRTESWLTNTFGRLALPPSERAGGLTFRTYQPGDLTGCAKIVRAATSDCDLALLWSDDALGRQLAGGGVGQTLVAEDGGQIVGLINWHSLPFLGRTEEVVSIIDLIAMPSMGIGSQRRLLTAALSRMKSEGAALALKLRIGDYANTPMLLSGFIPRWPDSYILATWGAEPEKFPPLNRMHLLWR